MECREKRTIRVKKPRREQQSGEPDRHKGFASKAAKKKKKAFYGAAARTHSGAESSEMMTVMHTRRVKEDPAGLFFRQFEIISAEKVMLIDTCSISRNYESTGAPRHFIITTADAHSLIMLPENGF